MDAGTKIVSAHDLAEETDEDTTVRGAEAVEKLYVEFVKYKVGPFYGVDTRPCRVQSVGPPVSVRGLPFTTPSRSRSTRGPAVSMDVEHPAELLLPRV